MKNYLISEAIGDIAGSAYEGKSRRIKDYDKVKMFSSTSQMIQCLHLHVQKHSLTNLICKAFEGCRTYQVFRFK